jgi:hypothetical protein
VTAPATPSAAAAPTNRFLDRFILWFPD